MGASRRTTGQERSLRAIRRAMARRSTLHLGYVGADGRQSERVVEPYEIRGSSFWGFDVNKGSVRQFQLDRIRRALVTGERFEPRWPLKPGEIEKKAARAGRDPRELAVDEAHKGAGRRSENPATIVARGPNGVIAACGMDWDNHYYFVPSGGQPRRVLWYDEDLDTGKTSEHIEDDRLRPALVRYRAAKGGNPYPGWPSPDWARANLWPVLVGHGKEPLRKEALDLGPALRTLERASYHPGMRWPLYAVGEVYGDPRVGDMAGREITDLIAHHPRTQTIRESATNLLRRVRTPIAKHAAVEVPTKAVRDYLIRSYPADTLGWVERARWSYNPRVSLDSIKAARRPGGRNLAKVEQIAEAFRGGKPMEPVVLVERPGERHEIADGYHRVLGAKWAGRSNIAAVIAHEAPEHGPWQTEMHARKLEEERRHMGGSLRAALQEKVAEDRTTEADQQAQDVRKYNDLIDKLRAQHFAPGDREALQQRGRWQSLSDIPALPAGIGGGILASRLGRSKPSRALLGIAGGIAAGEVVGRGTGAVADAIWRRRHPNHAAIEERRRAFQQASAKAYTDAFPPERYPDNGVLMLSSSAYFPGLSKQGAEASAASSGGRTEGWVHRGRNATSGLFLTKRTDPNTGRVAYGWMMGGARSFPTLRSMLHRPPQPVDAAMGQTTAAAAYFPDLAKHAQLTEAIGELAAKVPSLLKGLGAAVRSGEAGEALKGGLTEGRNFIASQNPSVKAPLAAYHTIQTGVGHAWQGFGQGLANATALKEPLEGARAALAKSPGLARTLKGALHTAPRFGAAGLAAGALMDKLDPQHSQHTLQHPVRAFAGAAASGALTGGISANINWAKAPKMFRWTRTLMEA